MKKLVLYLLIFTVLFSSLGQGAKALGDVTSDKHRWLMDKGWVIGRGGGSFQLDETITRAEFVKLIVLAKGDRTPVHGGGFFTDVSDVPKDHWARDYIVQGLEAGLVKGYPNGMFKPDADVTYGEVLAVLSRCHRDWNLGRELDAKWPLSYFDFARKEKMLEDVQLGAEDLSRPGVRKTVFAMVYNAFCADLDDKWSAEREAAWLPGLWFSSTYRQELLREVPLFDVSVEEGQEEEAQEQEDATENLEEAPPVVEELPEGLIDVSELLEVDAARGMVCGFKGEVECPSHLWIPNTISGVPIREIGPKAFMEIEIEELTLGEGLVVVGDGAFKGCKIQGLHLPESLERVENAGFFGNMLGQDLVLPKDLQSVGDYAFASCQIQGKVQLPEGLKEIGESAFYSNKIGAEITIPASVERIGRRAFVWNRIKTAVVMSQDTDFISGHEIKDENAFDKSVNILKVWE